MKKFIVLLLLVSLCAGFSYAENKDTPIYVKAAIGAYVSQYLADLGAPWYISGAALLAISPVVESIEDGNGIKYDLNGLLAMMSGWAINRGDELKAEFDKSLDAQLKDWGLNREKAVEIVTPNEPKPE